MKSTDNKIDGYTLTRKLRKARQKYPLTPSEQALYYELVAICNDDEWEDIFIVANDKLCSAIGISEGTLKSARLTLIQCNLIYYKSGKSKRKHGQYSFTTPLTTAKFEVDAVPNPVPNPAPNPADYIDKEKPNFFMGDSKKEEPDDLVEPYEGQDDDSLFTDCSLEYKNFILRQTGKEPRLDEVQDASLKLIISYFFHQPAAGDFPEMYVLSEWRKLLESWPKLRQWQQSRTRLSDINNDLQNILSELNLKKKDAANNSAPASSGRNTPRQTGIPPQARSRGGSVNDLQNLKRNRNSNSQERTEFTEAEIIE